MIVELKDVTKRYGTGPVTVTALGDVELFVAPGEFVVVLGPSGSGKTTLLNVIGALDTASSGTVRVNGIDISATSRRELFDFRRTSVSFIFQAFNLFPALTARENVQFGIDAADSPLDADEVLDSVGLGDKLTDSRTSSPAASSNGWPSPGPLPRATRSCSATSRRVSSTSRPASRSSICSKGRRRMAGR